MQDLLNEVIKRIQYVLPHVCVSVESIQKNNDVVRTGIIVKSKESNIAPVFYIDEMIKHGWTSDEIAIHICKSYQENDGSDMKDVGNLLLDFSNVESMLTIQLVNLEANKESWNSIPYEPFLDLAVIVLIQLESSTRASATVKVTKDMISMWNVSFEEVYHKAYLNFLNTPTAIYSMSDILSEMGYYDEEGYLAMIPMYIITNESKVHGATMMLKESSIRDLAGRLESDLIVIPSSIHELIAVPFRNTFEKDREDLDEMVRTVNGTEVDSTDILSDHVYLYKRDSGWYNLN